MGLDMYLYKKMYVGNDYKEPKDQIKIEVEGVKQERVSEITEKVMYWRKANHIHNWFVKNVQGGEDNCEESYVTREQLQDLLSTCEQVIKSLESSKTRKKKFETGWNQDGKTYGEKQVFTKTKIAKELLPTQSGFFFGSTDYDEYYLRDLIETAEQLKKLLVEDTKGDFYYRASW